MERRPLRRAFVRDTDEPSAITERIHWRAALRLLLCVALLCALTYVYATTDHRIDTSTTPSGQELSAVQIMQIYSRGLFEAVMLIGAGFGLYVATRAGE